MAILVTGSTGSIGSQVVASLAKRGAVVHALARKPEKAYFPPGVTPVRGDLADVDSMRSALAETRTLFLLTAVSPDEMTQVLVTLGLAREAGIRRIVYFSVIHSDLYTDVPHFSAKYAAERMIGQFQMQATVLRPAYFMQNDLNLKDALLESGVYPVPLGSAGVAMADARDITEAVVRCLIERDRATDTLPAETLDVTGPDALTGEEIAEIWTDALGRTVRYGGDDMADFEQRYRTVAPSWMAYDMRIMMERIQQRGMAGRAGEQERLAALLGRAPRSYRTFAAETAKKWLAS
jgi:uncharacterized protein YbjT (DUF2867 family)